MGVKLGQSLAHKSGFAGKGDGLHAAAGPEFLQQAGDVGGLRTVPIAGHAPGEVRVVMVHQTAVMTVLLLAEEVFLLVTSPVPPSTG
jgi:hypothetical protein